MLRVLERKIASDSLPEFKKLLYTSNNWREEILNYSDWHNNRWLCRREA